jgi:plastocyanin
MHCMTERSALTVRAAVLLAILVVCFTTGCINPQTTPTHSPGTKAPLTMNTQPMPTFSGETPVPILSNGTEVKMQYNDFEPRTLIIMNGTTVTWINEDETREYSAVSDAGTPVAFQSGTLSKGGVFTFRFTQPGTYPYHSAIPPEIRGEIIVL